MSGTARIEWPPPSSESPSPESAHPLPNQPIRCRIPPPRAVGPASNRGGHSAADDPLAGPRGRRTRSATGRRARPCSHVSRWRIPRADRSCWRRDLPGAATGRCRSASVRLAACCSTSPAGRGRRPRFWGRPIRSLYRAGWSRRAGLNRRVRSRCRGPAREPSCGQRRVRAGRVQLNEAGRLVVVPASRPTESGITVRWAYEVRFQPT